MSALDPRLEHDRVVLEDDEERWTVRAAHAKIAARLRHAFRDYLETYGHPDSDFAAAESVYGELISTCVLHAPGAIRVEFGWADATLTVTDTSDRLRMWPFSADDSRAESTHHAFAIVRALCDHVRVTRDPDGGTRASVVLPVTRRETRR